MSLDIDTARVITHWAFRHVRTAEQVRQVARDFAASAGLTHEEDQNDGAELMYRPDDDPEQVVPLFVVAINDASFTVDVRAPDGHLAQVFTAGFVRDQVDL